MLMALPLRSILSALKTALSQCHKRALPYVDGGKFTLGRPLTQRIRGKKRRAAGDDALHLGTVIKPASHATLRKKRMYFKITIGLNEVYMQFPREFGINSLEDPRVTITLRETTQEELWYYNISCTTVCEAIIHKQRPSDVVKDIEDFWQKDSGDSISLSNLSPSLRDFILTSSEELAGKSTEMMAIIFWRLGQNGPINYWRLKRMEWSTDGINWRRTPVDFAVSDYRPAMLFVTDETDAAIKLMIAGHQTEPVGHELLREAWSLKNSHPRSALVIGISAIETGIKELIGDLVPAAHWLAMYSPSPPLDKIMKSYIPTLPARLKFNEKVLPPPVDVHKNIIKGIEKRNKLVHGNASSTTEDEIKELLLSIKDVLYLCDYYRGCDWAIEHMREETRAHLSKC